MPFTLIKGSFHVVGYSPDGDSIRFAPDDPSLLSSLSGPPAKLNARGHAQLRIEAIDTLETHYASGGGNYHQPLALAKAAADRLVDFAGITNVVWSGNNVVAADDATPGYILSRAVEKNRRPVAFVFAGDAAEQDGASVHLDVARLADSYNRAALTEGLAYPTFYTGLFHDLRDSLAAEAASARNAGLGVWNDDGTLPGFDAVDLGVITADVPILPKLFRRLTDYMTEYGSAVDFKAKLEQSQEPVLDLVTSNFTHFDTFIEQASGSTEIRLTRAPELLVFDAMPQRPVNQFQAFLGNEIATPAMLFGEGVGPEPGIS